MKNKKQIVPVVIGIFFCGLVVCVAMLCAGIYSFTPLSLPVYKMEQIDSIHKGYRRTTLTSGNTVYVMDYEEYALTAFGEQPTEMIGRFPVSWEDSGLYAIPGQDVSAYALEYDPMYQSVYRNVNHPPFDWRAADFQLMRLYLPNNPIETMDTQIIQDALASIKAGAAINVTFQADGNYADYENYGLQSFSDSLPGLAYNFSVHVAPNGDVYLAENYISNEWFPAGAVFTEWVLTKK